MTLLGGLTSRKNLMTGILVAFGLVGLQMYAGRPISPNAPLIMGGIAAGASWAADKIAAGQLL